MAALRLWPVLLLQAETRARDDLDVAIGEAHSLIPVAAPKHTPRPVPPEHCVAEDSAALRVVEPVEGIAEVDIALLVELDVWPLSIGVRHDSVGVNLGVLTEVAEAAPRRY